MMLISKILNSDKFSPESRALVEEASSLISDHDEEVSSVLLLSSSCKNLNLPDHIRGAFGFRPSDFDEAFQQYRWQFEPTATNVDFDSLTADRDMERIIRAAVEWAWLDDKLVSPEHITVALLVGSPCMSPGQHPFQAIGLSFAQEVLKEMELDVAEHKNEAINLAGEILPNMRGQLERLRHISPG